MLNLPFGQIGKVTQEKILTIKGQGGEVILNLPLDALKEAWQKPLRW
jgi:phosphoribosylformylglycinamidine (FGAM) synthase-like enzyme